MRPLTPEELAEYRKRYPEEAKTMTAFAERYREQGQKQGLEQGRQEGRREGEAQVLLQLLETKFGALTAEQRQRVEAADAETLLEWSRRVLTAQSLDDVWQ